MRYTFPKSLLTAAALFAGTTVHAQITFKNAFPGMTFSNPVYIGELPGVTNKTFVVLEQHAGQATLVTKKNNAWVKQTLLKIDVNQEGEMGLLGIAFHPDFKTNHKYYISYDPPGTFFNILEERTTDSTLMKDAGTARVLIKISDKYNNHNGGTIAFGPKDGFLYMGTGDGGSAYDPDGNGQNKNTLLAKMLRIDVDKKENGKEYGVPSDNPFVNGGGYGEVFAYGLRNPWKWSFDPLNGDLWVGDVGQDNIEEVDIVTKGGNYGWKSMEGFSGTNNGMTLPIFSYDHNTGKCVIGGVVYRGNPASKYYGTYFVADYQFNNFWNLKKNGMDKATVTELGTTPAQLSSFGTDAEGRIYACGVYSNTVYLLDSPDLAPPVTGVSNGLLAMTHGRTHSLAAGEILNPEIFDGSDRLNLFSLEGVALATINLNQPRLPVSVQAGAYYLLPAKDRPAKVRPAKAASAQTGPSLLIVK